MKWIPIEKAKVKFDQPYLVHRKQGGDVVGTLDKSETTASGVRHSFSHDGEELVTDATHVAVITDPTAE